MKAPFYTLKTVIACIAYAGKEKQFLQERGCSSMSEYCKKYGPAKDASVDDRMEFLIETSFKIA